MKPFRDLHHGDLPAIRDALRGYRDYLKSKSMAEPSPWWTQKVSAGLKAQGFPIKDGPGAS